MIEASEVAFGYRKGTPVISGFDLSVACGERVAITGPSGSGKSTVLYLLGALVSPWSGTIAIGGIEIGGLSDAARSALRSTTIGFVFQDGMLDQRRSVLENVTEGAIYRGWSAAQARPRGRALLERLQVAVEPDRRATDLSGGQAQRVALCRVLLGRPSVILADEPTGNLDRGNAILVERILREEAEAGAAVVVVTHSHDLARRCDRTVRL